MEGRSASKLDAIQLTFAGFQQRVRTAAFRL